MRPIKFRGISHAPLVGDSNFITGHSIYVNYDDKLAYINDMAVEFESVSQYTGLTDKNGREIYEGDVLLIKAQGYDPIISEVVWGGTEYPAFDLPKYDGYGMNAFSAIQHNDVEEKIEIIGNIYENPELLEESK